MTRFFLCAIAVSFLVAGPVVLRGQDAAPAAPPPVVDEAKTPWLKGVDIPPAPPSPSPVVPAEIALPDGGALPATLTEDVAVLLSVNSPIFDEKPPASWKGAELQNPEWTGQPSVRWFFEDVQKNKSTLASCGEILPANQMKVTPLDPTESGAVTVTIARPMKYMVGPDKFKGCFVNGSRSFTMAVTDTTPPTCGLKISTDEKSATFWTVENPAHKSPPPRTADVICKGDLFTFSEKAETVTIANMELGSRMVVPAPQAKLTLPRKGKIKLEVILQDNFRVDEKTLRFGISNGAEESPVPVGPANAPEFDLEGVAIPEKPFLFIEAADPSGNKQVLFVPVEFK